MKKIFELIVESYRREKENAKNKFDVDEKDFLPAALEVLEKPASPIGHFIIWAICIFFCLALIWSIVGHIDVVASAQGKIVPVGQTKVVQSFENGVVREIFVRNGGRVEEGDLLLELDSTQASADIDSLNEKITNAQLAADRNSWLLLAIDEQHDKEFSSDAGIPEHELNLQRAIVLSQLNEYRAQRKTIEEKVLETKAELKASLGQLKKYEELLPLLKEQVESLKELAAEGIASRFQYLQKNEQYVSTNHDFIIEKDRVAQIESAVRSLDQQLTQHYEQTKVELLEGVFQASIDAHVATQELVKAGQTQKLLKIRSPVKGVVQQLSVHTIGGVIRSGDAIMAIVPADRNLQAEVQILNKDIGFVNTGQSVEVKLEAFPFTKYGVIEGELATIDQDSVEVENVGLVYPARVKLLKQNIDVAGKTVDLSPGMGVTAEIKIGQRRIIEFVLSPIFRYKQESLRER